MMKLMTREILEFLNSVDGKKALDSYTKKHYPKGPWKVIDDSAPLGGWLLMYNKKEVMTSNDRSQLQQVANALNKVGATL